MREYFKTVPDDPNIQTYIEKAKNQNERVLSVFELFGLCSPSKCWRIYSELFQECPITSIRRSLTTLTDRGKLQKTSMLQQGMYGRMEHVWKLAE